MTFLIAIGAPVIIAMLVAYLLFYRLIIWALFSLVGRLSPYLPGGRYQSQADPEKYAPLRKPLNGSYY